MDTTLFEQLNFIGRDLQAFAPELLLCGTIVLLLALRLFSSLDRLHMGYVALVLTIAALVLAFLQWVHNTALDPRQPNEHALNIFTGLLVFDNFTIFLKLFLIGFAALIIELTLLTRIPDKEDSADFYTLLLGATVGMMLMSSANHLLMIFIAIEMASLPSYAMAGFLKGRRQSSEAALKYVVYGGGAAGVMLYGMSILAGKFGTGYLPDLAAAVLTAQLDPLLILGILFILIGFAFKLAAVPFHFWCPDVFEGASAEVAGFLSVASKGAALALLGRFSLVLAGLAGAQPEFATWQEAARYLVPALAFFAALTATFGNLAAFPQTNLKRLLAYSTIAHAGYMMMGLATLTAEGAAAVLFYLVVYLFMNLGAFAIVAFLRNLTGSEDLRDFRGLVNRAPVLVISLAFCLLSLLGMPPLAGFAAKFQIFQVLFRSSETYQAAGMPGYGSLMIALLVIGGLNSVLSLVYYIKVLKVMILDKPLEEVEGREPARLHVGLPATAYAALIAVVTLVLGVFWGPLSNGSNKGANPFQAVPTNAVALAQEKT
jgi:NADH-quinone oxidoreductase subunit N